LGPSFKILAFSDWRVQPFAPLCDYILKYQPDLVLYAGDDTERFGPIPRESLATLLNDFEGLHAEMKPESVLVSSSNTTDKRFRKDVTECLGQALILSDLVATAKSEGVWIIPSESRKKENCLFYWETGMSEPSYAEQLAALSKLGLGAVIGNDCSSRDKLRLNRNKVYDLHQNPLVKNKIAVLGLEGAPVGGPGIVLYEEEDALSHLETQWKQASSIGFDRSILVTHAPPRGILDLSTRFGVNHIGSEAVRSFIEAHNINLVICGHSHINGGKYTELSGVTILNIASHDHRDALGKVATIELIDDSQIAIDVDLIYPSGSVFLNSMPEIGRKRAEWLHALGIGSVTDLIEANRTRMVAIPGISDRMVSKWILHAEAITNELAFRLHHPSWAELDPSKSIIYDIETDLGPTHLWCIGLWDPVENKIVQFFEKNDENDLFCDSINVYSIASKCPRIDHDKLRMLRRWNP